METVCQQFVDALVHETSGLQAAYKDVLDDWSPEEPPVTTLFAALGDRIADDLETFEPGVKSRIFALIESAMGSRNQALVTAVATGLIEAMVSRVASAEDRLQRVTRELGILSRNHAEAWLGR